MGNRMRSRRLQLKRQRGIVAQNAEISVPQLARYEAGEGHPPAATLHRIALALGTSSSALMGETRYEDDEREQVETMMASIADPVFGAVLAHMQNMTDDDRQSLQAVARTFANRPKAPETAEVMR